MADAFRINDQQAPHFITLTVVDWVDVFTRKEYKDVLVDSLNYCIEHKGLQVYEFVIMSNHLHAIVSVTNGQLSDVIRDFKKFTAKKILSAINSDKESRKGWMLKKFAYAGLRNSNNKTYQFWQQDYHAVELSNKEMWKQRVDYIHSNPVVEGIVLRPEDYVYSSAGYYHDRKSLVMLSEL